MSNSERVYQLMCERRVGVTHAEVCKTCHMEPQQVDHIFRGLMADGLIQREACAYRVIKPVSVSKPRLSLTTSL